MKTVSKEYLIDPSKITSIMIYSGDVDVNIYACNFDTIKASLSGSVNEEACLDVTYTNYDSTLDFKVTSAKVRIAYSLSLSIWLPNTLFDKLFVKSIDGNIHINASFKEIEVIGEDGNINIEPYNIPDKVTVTSSDGDIFVGSKFKYLFIKTSDGDIDVCSEVLSDKIEINSGDGDIIIEAPSKDISIKASDGDISLNINAKSDCCINIQASDGDVDVYLRNIGNLTTILKTEDGWKENSHTPNGSYTATLKVKTVDGDIFVK